MADRRTSISTAALLNMNFDDDDTGTRTSSRRSERNRDRLSVIFNGSTASVGGMSFAQRQNPELVREVRDAWRNISDLVDGLDSLDVENDRENESTCFSIQSEVLRLQGLEESLHRQLSDAYLQEPSYSLDVETVGEEGEEDCDDDDDDIKIGDDGNTDGVRKGDGPFSSMPSGEDSQQATPPNDRSLLDTDGESSPPLFGEGTQSKSAANSMVNSVDYSALHSLEGLSSGGKMMPRRSSSRKGAGSGYSADSSGDFSLEGRRTKSRRKPRRGKGKGLFPGPYNFTKDRFLASYYTNKQQGGKEQLPTSDTREKNLEGMSPEGGPDANPSSEFDDVSILTPVSMEGPSDDILTESSRDLLRNARRESMIRRARGKRQEVALRKLKEQMFQNEVERIVGSREITTLIEDDEDHEHHKTDVVNDAAATTPELPRSRPKAVIPELSQRGEVARKDDTNLALEILGRIGATLFGQSSYEVRALGSRKKFVRTKQGTFSVGVAAALVVYQMLQDSELFGAALTVLPFAAMFVEVHFPHNIEETTIAIALTLWATMRATLF